MGGMRRVYLGEDARAPTSTEDPAQLAVRQDLTHVLLALRPGATAKTYSGPVNHWLRWCKAREFPYVKGNPNLPAGNPLLE
jgi:hypothetical protein